MSDNSEHERGDLNRLSKESQGTSDQVTRSDLERVSNADLFSLLTSYMNSKFSGIEDNFSETTKSLSKKVKKVENSFNFKGHQIQYEFNTDLQDNIEKAVDCIRSKRYHKTESALRDSLDLIRKRNKHIRIADKSEGGWKTVQEYLSDDVASDSEDEKKIRAADSRAVKKIKASKAEKSSSNARKRPAEAAGSAAQVSHNGGNTAFFSYSMQPFRGSGQSGLAQGKRAKPGDQCYNCGLFGHWARDCKKDAKNSGYNVNRGPSA